MRRGAALSRSLFGHLAPFSSLLFLVVFFLSPLSIRSAEATEIAEAACLAPSERPAQFTRVIVAAEGGWWMPWGNVESVVDPAPSAGLLLRTDYYRGVELLLALRYQQPSAISFQKNGTEVPLSLRQISGDVGLMFPLSPPNDPRFQFRFGGGFSMFLIRADRPVGNLLLDDNESDFGHWFRLETPALPVGLVALRLFVQQQTVWTLDQRSHFLLTGATVEGRVW